MMTRARLFASGGALCLGALAITGPVATMSAAASPSPAVQECLDASAARVINGSGANEPALYPDSQAKQYGVIKDSARLADGSVSISTVFHVISDAPLSAAETARKQTMIADQMDVLNAAYSGGTSAAASDTPFRFDLVDTTWTVNAAWAHVTPGKTERDLKQALYTGDSTTLNVYVADIGGGLLGWAYFPKGYNNGRDFIDGVVILDESMPGGTAVFGENQYNEGDTLTHEVGHWLMLEHTFKSGCSASNDGVEDTPREAHPQFGCPLGADTCYGPGIDPIHNFMDYSEDPCMSEFTAGQADRMSDAWVAFRAGGNG